MGSRAEQQRTLQYLEWREKQYDRRVWVPVHGLGSAAGDPPAVAQALTFVATDDRCAPPEEWLARWLAGALPLLLCLDWQFACGHARAASSLGTWPPSRRRAANPNYLGPASEEAIAAQVAAAAGPSGPNCDYVFRLADAMRAMGVEDSELFSLEARVRVLMAEQAVAGGAAAAAAAEAAAAAAEDAGAAAEGQPQQPLVPA